MAQKLGFGEITGLPLQAEGSGHFPEFPLTGRRQGSTLSYGEIANLSIGQGTALATTVQMARMAATIASRGKGSGPVLVKGDIAKPATELELKAEDWDLLHRAMRCDVPGTVSGRGASEHVNIAMMTGTSQWRPNQKQDLAQVIGFAPVENPEVAFAVVLEGRPEQSMSGGGMAAPVAKRMVECYFGHSVERDSKLDASNGTRSSSPDEEVLKPQPIQNPKMDSNTESRWRKLQSEFQLPELPNAAAEVKSSLVGSWPRATQLSFSAPRLEVLRWLESIQVGHSTIVPSAQQSVGILAPSLSKIVQESWLQKTQALSYLKDRSEKKAVSMILYPVRPFETFGGARLFMSATTDDQIRVVITTQGRSRVLIAE
jgi:hypothetical protein